MEGGELVVDVNKDHINYLHGIHELLIIYMD